MTTTGIELDIKHNPHQESLTYLTTTGIELDIRQAKEISSDRTRLRI
jgi:hypothetical protein